MLTLLDVSARPEMKESAAKELETAARKVGSRDSEEAELDASVALSAPSRSSASHMH